MNNAKVTGLVVGAIGAVLLLAGTTTHSWWSGSTERSGGKIKMQAGIGLGGIQVCQTVDDSGRSYCSNTTFNVIPEKKAKKSWVMSGTISYWASWLALFTLVFSLGVAAGGNQLGGAVSPARLSALLTGVAFIFGLAFLILKPDLQKQLAGTEDMTLGYSLFLHLTGAATACVGSVFLSIRREPGQRLAGALPSQPAAQPAYNPQHMPVAPAAASPLCQQCNSPVRWVQQYQRNYCDRCAAYV